jgi:outer membrane lipoprotein carrier protein
MMMRGAMMKIWMPFLGLMLVCCGLRAQDVTDKLLEALDGMQDLQGAFTQRQYGQNGVLLVESSGSFKLLRPGYFAWEIEVPDSQLIIADPQWVWHYDRDLQTVTRRPVAGQANMSPLQVLGGDETALREGYQVVEEGEGVFALTPLAGDPGFRRLSLKIRGYLVERMEILDNLSQRVTIEFGNLEVGGGLSPQDFSFVPPEDADTFYYDQ